MPLSPVPQVPVVFQKSYQSGNQTITAAGALTLAHGLGVKPGAIVARLVCQTAELGYTVGDSVEIECGPQNGGSAQGVVVVADVTNLNVRFGSNANTFMLLNKGTGAGPTGITNANWRITFEAYA